MQPLFNTSCVLLRISPSLPPYHMRFFISNVASCASMLSVFVFLLHRRHSCVALVSTFLIIGIAATAPTSGEAVLDPPDEESEKSEEDEEDDYDDGDDDVAFHCCERRVSVSKISRKVQCRGSPM